MGSRSLLAVAVALLAVPTLGSFLPPGADLLQHELEVSIMRGLGSARFPLDVYAWNLGHPNQLFHLLSYVLSFGVGVRWATKLVFAFSLALWPLGARRIGKAGGAPAWNVLALTPLATGWAFFWGMAPLILGIGCLIWFLPDLDRFLRAPSRRTAALMVAETLVLFEAHLAVVICFGAAAVALSLGRPWVAVENAKRVAPGALSIALMAGHWATDRPPPSAQGVSLLGFDGVITRIADIPYAMFGSHELPTILAAAAGFCLCIGARFARAPSSLAISGTRAWLDYHRYECVAVAFLLLYLAFPSRIGAATFLNLRFLAIAAVVAGATVGPRSAPSYFSRWVSGLYLGAMSVAMVPIYLANEAELRDLTQVVAAIREPGATMMLQLQRVGPRSVFSFVAGDAWAVAETGGRALNSWADASSIGPVRVRPGLEWPSAHARLLRDAYDLVPSVDMSHFRYALLHTSSPADADLVARLLRGEARALAQSGVWTLLESTLPLAPMASPDYDLPNPTPETLRDRLNRADAQAAGDPPR